MLRGAAEEAGAAREDPLAAERAAGELVLGEGLEVIVVDFRRQVYGIIGLVLAAVGADDEPLLSAQGVARGEAMDQLAPELAVVAFAVKAAKSPQFVEAEEDYLAPPIRPD